MNERIKNKHVFALLKPFETPSDDEGNSSALSGISDVDFRVINGF